MCQVKFKVAVDFENSGKLLLSLFKHLSQGFKLPEQEVCFVFECLFNLLVDALDEFAGAHHDDFLFSLERKSGTEHKLFDSFLLAKLHFLDKSLSVNFGLIWLDPKEPSLFSNFLRLHVINLKVVVALVGFTLAANFLNVLRLNWHSNVFSQSVVDRFLLDSLGVLIHVVLFKAQCNRLKQSSWIDETCFVLLRQVAQTEPIGVDLVVYWSRQVDVCSLLVLNELFRKLRLPIQKPIVVARHMRVI